MFLSDISRNHHLDPLNHIPARQESLPSFLSQATRPPKYISHGISQLSSALYAANPAPFNMNALSRDEMERFQELSNNFEPTIQGPLVTHKKPTSAIAIEFANADPVFATKTRALAITHPQSRLMKGDGNCGWRAVAFGYFENLFNLRDPLRIQQELARLQGLTRLLDQKQEYLYDIFVEATEEVFGKILEMINRGERDDTFLVDEFNNEYNSDAIITHFRLLTSAWMKRDHLRYQAFLPVPLDQYCSTRIETVKTEIDEIGLQALLEGVIADSNLVEILYLDRSDGQEVTPHVLRHVSPTVGTIRLLYRPGHYDLLYQDESAMNRHPLVNLQYAMSSDYSTWGAHELSFDVDQNLMAIPGLMMDPTFALPSTMSHAPPDLYRVSQPQEIYQPSMPSPLAPAVPVTSAPPPRVSTAPPPMSSLPTRSSDGPQIRLNPLVMKPNLSHSLPVTAPFKNSPYNQAHFQNQDFEPIHWEPHESRK